MFLRTPEQEAIVIYSSAPTWTREHTQTDPLPVPFKKQQLACRLESRQGRKAHQQKYQKQNCGVHLHQADFFPGVEVLRLNTQKESKRDAHTNPKKKPQNRDTLPKTQTKQHKCVSGKRQNTPSSPPFSSAIYAAAPLLGISGEGRKLALCANN